MHDALIRQLRAKLDTLKKQDPARYHALEARIRAMVNTPDTAVESSRADPAPHKFSKSRFESLVARLKKRSDVRDPYALAHAIESGRVRK